MMSVERASTTYTTRRVLAILEALEVLPEPRTVADVRTMKMAHGKQSGWFEDQMVEQADVQWALSQLPTEDDTYRCCYLYYVQEFSVGMDGRLGPPINRTLHDVAVVTGLSPATVHRRVTAGLREIVRLLREGCGRDWEVRTSEGARRV